MQKDRVYRSILDQLGSVPKAYLKEVDTFLRNLTKEIRQKEQNRIEILDLAGSWSDMSEKEFEDYMKVVKNTRSEMFNREIEL